MVPALKQRMAGIWRQRRMTAFLARMQPQPGMRVLDIGGTPELWEMVQCPIDITLLNLPGAPGINCDRPKRAYRLIEADITGEVSIPDRSFDIVFSNSVIEHVGDEAKQFAFAKTVRRLGVRYWVQTPALWFPIEAHCNLPFWWFYPPPLQERWLDRWRDRGRNFIHGQMQTTRAIRLPCLKRLIPDARVYVERVGGLPKSYSLYLPS